MLMLSALALTNKGDINDMLMKGVGDDLWELLVEQESKGEVGECGRRALDCQVQNI